MKKKLLMIIATMALLAVSCQKEKEEELPTFTAHADNGGMKTDLVGNLIHWNNTDQVKVFGDFGYAIYGVSPRGDDPTWATLSPITSQGITGFLPYRFVYPASMAEGGLANNATLYVNYPAKLSIGNAPLSHFPMYGESDHREVAFCNLGGLVKIVLPDIDRKIFQIRVSTDEPNNGKYRINNICGLTYAGENMATDKTVIIQAQGRTFAQGDCVYIAMPAGEYHNFTIDIIPVNQQQRATKVGPLVDVQTSAITTITLSNLDFVDNELPIAMLMERAFDNTNATSIIFQYNYTDAVPAGAERIDYYSSNPETIPIYKKIVNNVCLVYTSASEIYAPANSSCLFSYTNSTNHPLRQIDLGDGFNTSNVTNMSRMFYNCRNLTSLDLSSFNTANVTDMNHMFYECSNLTNLDLSSFNTENVTDMSCMFFICYNSTILDLSSFNTENVTNMSEMFYGCHNLTSLDLSSFNTENVTDMNRMFADCHNLTSLDLSSFNTDNVTNMNYMFGYCQYLTSLDLSSFNTANVTNMSGMFAGCHNLTSLDLSSFYSSSLTSFSNAFNSCTALQSIQFSSSFTLSNTCFVSDALHTVGTFCSTTIKCNNQTKNRLLEADPGSRVAWDLY